MAAMAGQPIKILVVDDDPSLLAVLEASLRLHDDYQVTAIVSAAKALQQIERQEFDLVVTDYSLGDPSINGLTLLRAVRRRSDHPLVIIITAFASLEITLESIHLGAYDFLTKPFQIDELQLVIRNAASQLRLEDENQRLRQRVAELITALDGIEHQQRDLLDRIRQLDFEGGPGEGASPNPLLSALPTPSAQALRRRRVREQMAAYVRMGETIHEQLTRERQKIEALFQTGLLPESAYHQALMNRKQDNTP